MKMMRVDDKDYKICKICYEAKEFKDYHKHKMGHRGLHPYCKPCRNQASWQTQLENAAIAGDKSVHECTKCERLMRGLKKVCKRCLN